jgi:hypothetical protein
MNPGDGQNAYDNHIFIIHELFLYTNAIFLNADKFKYVSDFMEKEYFYAKTENIWYPGLPQDVGSITKNRKERLKSNQTCLRTDLLGSRAESSGIDFELMMQTDFILFLRSEIKIHLGLFLAASIPKPFSDFPN